jgi:hypothetical protein
MNYDHTTQTQQVPERTTQQCPAHGSHREALEAYGLIWRTLAPYSEVLGRTPRRSSFPRRHLLRARRAVQSLDADGHGAAA